MGVLSVRSVARILICVMLAGGLMSCKSSNHHKNSVPKADAGPDQTVRIGTELVLSGRNSYDADGPILSFHWQQVSGTPVTLDQVTPSTVKFTAPKVKGDLAFALTVGDNQGAQATDQVVVHVVGPGDPNQFLIYPYTTTQFCVDVGLSSSSSVPLDSVGYDLVMNVTQHYHKLDGSLATRTFPAITQSRNLTGGNTCSNGHSGFDFDIPEARIEDLTDVNKSDRNDISLIIDLKVQNLTASVNYSIQVLNVSGNPISIPPTPGLEPGEVQVDTNYLLDNLGDSTLESSNTAQAYYQLIDPDNKKTTLKGWLAATGYYGAKVERARYMNQFDLGLARDMRVWSNDQGYVYSFVENYPNIDSMVEGTNHIATVAMEYNPNPPSGVPATTFYTFVRDPISGEQKRVVSMDFDGRGEKFMPGTCEVCHGKYPAGFLPWDLNTFAFSDARHEGRGPGHEEPVLSRANQEAVFKDFNKTILKTNLTDLQRQLINGWYGGDGMPNDTFNDNYIPDGWRSPAAGEVDGNPVSASELYTKVYGPTCRACHTRLSEFATYQDFVNSASTIYQYVYVDHAMPRARVTMDDFWVGTPSEVGHAPKTRAELMLENLQYAVPGLVTP